MRLYCLDKSFSPVAVIDNYETLIWDERYNTCGEFLLTLRIDDPILSAIQPDFYIAKENPLIKSNILLMVVEEFAYPSEDDTIVKVSGRDFKSVLDRRCIYSKDPFAELRTGESTETFSLESAVKAVLEDSFIPKEGEVNIRKIDRFHFVDGSSSKAAFTEASFSANHESVLSWIEKACQAYSIGFDLRFNMLGTIDFYLKDQNDRTSELVFAKEYGNLADDSCIESVKNYKNTVITGEDESDRRTFQKANVYGFDRKEVYVTFDAEALQNDTTFEDRARRELASHIVECTLDGLIDSGSFAYNEIIAGKTTYHLGDIALIISRRKYGIQAYISEYIYSEENGEIKEYPSFTYMPETAGQVIGPTPGPGPGPTPTLLKLYNPIVEKTSKRVFSVKSKDSTLTGNRIASSIGIYLNDNFIEYIQLPSYVDAFDGTIWDLKIKQILDIDWSQYEQKLYMFDTGCSLTGDYSTDGDEWLPLSEDFPGIRPIQMGIKCKFDSDGDIETVDNFFVQAIDDNGTVATFTLDNNALAVSFLFYPYEEAPIGPYRVSNLSIDMKIKTQQAGSDYSSVDQNLVDFLFELGELTGRPITIDLGNYVGEGKLFAKISEITSGFVKASAVGKGDSDAVALPDLPISEWEYPVKADYILKITQVKDIEQAEEVLTLK